MDTENVVIYEQPLNELIRVCLRLEQLLAQIDSEIQNHSVFGTRDVIATFIDILQLLERPDLKAKLAKELAHQMLILSRLQNTPNVDKEKLEKLLQQLDKLNHIFITSSGKIGQRLREIELLNNLRLHLATPGGGCSFDIPVYHYWLQQPIEIRLAIIHTWLSELDSIRHASSLILKLVREESRIHKKTAMNGFHQELLDAQTNLRLIRVFVLREEQAYPEISLSRHFLSIRFFEPNIDARSAQYLKNISFSLAYCTA